MTVTILYFSLILIFPLNLHCKRLMGNPFTEFGDVVLKFRMQNKKEGRSKPTMSSTDNLFVGFTTGLLEPHCYPFLCHEMSVKAEQCLRTPSSLVRSSLGSLLSEAWPSLQGSGSEQSLVKHLRTDTGFCSWSKPGGSLLLSSCVPAAFYLIPKTALLFVPFMMDFVSL